MNVMRTPESGAAQSTQAALAPAPFPFSPIILPGVFRALDLAAILIGAALATLLVEDDSRLAHKAACVTSICFGHMFLGDRAQLFSIMAIMRPFKRADDMVIALATSFLLFLSVAFALDASAHFSVNWLFSFVGSAAGLLVIFRITAFHLLKAMSRQNIVGHNMAVLGVGEQARRFINHFERARPYFTHLSGVYQSETASAGASFEGQPVLGDIEALFDAVRSGKVDAVVVAMPWNADRRVLAAIERLKELPVSVYLSTDLVGFELSFRPVLGTFTELPVFEVMQRPISGWSSLLKTMMDYVVASMLILALLPLLAAVALAIKIDSPGPILFRQARLGFNNRTFQIYKFRSMHHGPHPEVDVRQAQRSDPRITRVGRFIRATSMDELPQLFNVLDGTMSLVGPRPHAVSHNVEYGRQIRGYFARHKVKPGITGWAQVNGLRGETEKLGKMEARIQYDVFYAENWSLFFDIRILVMTFLVVLFQKTAY